MIKALIFDCFGVLVSEAWRPFCEAHFSDAPEARQHAHDTIHLLDRGIIHQAEFIQTIAELSGLSREETKAALYRSSVPDPRLFAYIRSAKNEYRLAILSNIQSRGRLEEVLDNEQIALFDVVGLSCEIGHLKPDERAYRAVLDQLGLEPEVCLLVDDVERNIAAAKALGMKGIVYQNFAQFEVEARKLLQ